MDLGRALAGHDPERSLVLLAHQPRAFDAAVKGGVELQLSGHTHGGQIFPFNYAVPGQVQNSLFRFADLLQAHPDGAALSAELQLPLEAEEADPAEPRNEFSGKAFKVLNFVADVPVRIDELLPPLDPMADELGSVVFALVEFQVIDAPTARQNEQGEASHERYKRRQLKTVLRRLSRGLVVPKKRRRKARAPKAT